MPLSHCINRHSLDLSTSSQKISKANFVSQTAQKKCGYMYLESVAAQVVHTQCRFHTQIVTSYTWRHSDTGF